MDFAAVDDSEDQPDQHCREVHFGDREQKGIPNAGGEETYKVLNRVQVWERKANGLPELMVIFVDPVKALEMEHSVWEIYEEVLSEQEEGELPKDFKGGWPVDYRKIKGRGLERADVQSKRENQEEVDRKGHHALDLQFPPLSWILVPRPWVVIVPVLLEERVSGHVDKVHDSVVSYIDE